MPHEASCNSWGPICEFLQASNNLWGPTCEVVLHNVISVTALVLHNVKGGCGWDWMRVVVCSRTPIDPILLLKSNTPHCPTGTNSLRAALVRL